MASTLLKLAAVVIVVGVAWQWYERSQRLPPVVEGYFRPEHRPVAALFRKFVEDGTERGGSFAVYQNGEPLIEMWGGYADPSSRRPWRNDTVTMVWSVTKGVSAVAVAKLVERGLLDYKKEVREYWPQFAQNDKSNITVEMLLSHQAGLGSLGGRPISLMEYKHEWEKVEQIMAAAPPDFPPGSAVGYQSFTLGMYVDALIRRVDPKHRNLTRFFDEEIAKPYGIDFYIGLPLPLYYRAARQFVAPPWKFLSFVFDPPHYPMIWERLINNNGFTMRASRSLDFFNKHIEILNDPYQMEVGIGSLMGFTSARELAKFYDYLANGGTIKGKQVLTQPLVDMFSHPLTETLPSALTGRVGASLFSQGMQVFRTKWGTHFGHDGYGGQQANADPGRRLGLAYVTNFHWPNLVTPPSHFVELENLFYECYEKHHARLEDEDKK